MFSILRRLFSRKSKPTQARTSANRLEAQLNYARLEPRLVLNASFTLAGGLLTLNDFTAGDSLGISDDGLGNYLFSLSAGNVWTGTDSASVTGNGLQVLTAVQTDIHGLDVLDNNNVDFDVTFSNAVSFNQFDLDINGDTITGDLVIDGVGNITQAAGANVAIISFDANAASTTLTESGNDFDVLTLSGGDATIVDADNVTLSDISLTGDFSLTGGAVGAITNVDGGAD